jgi:hypothetical protein
MERDPENTTDAPQDGGAASDDGGGFSRRFVEGILPDMMRKTASGALSTVMMTEEVVRTVLGAASRELLQYAREQVDKGKADIVALVTRELQEHLRDMDISEEMERILQRMDVEVSATVRFVPRGGGAGLAPDVKVETRLGIDESAAAPGAASSAASTGGNRPARKKAVKTSASTKGSAAARKERARKSPAPKRGAAAQDAD